MARDRKFPGVRPIDGWKTLSSNRQTDRPGDSAVRVAIAIVGGRAGEAGDEDFPLVFRSRCDATVWFCKEGRRKGCPLAASKLLQNVWQNVPIRGPCVIESYVFFEGGSLPASCLSMEQYGNNKKKRMQTPSNHTVEV